jgi:hypothetical protein
MMRLRFRLGPIVWEPEYKPDRTPPRGHAKLSDLVVILVVVAGFVTAVVVTW